MSVHTLELVRSRGGPLDRCAGDAASFLGEIWGRRAAVTAGTEGGGFEDLLELDDVDRFITSTALRTPFFRLVKAGERIDTSAYTRSGRAGSRSVDGIADPARVAALFEDGATIVLQGMHRWSEPVARFCRGLELELGHACQANAYITPAGAQGLDLHEDPHDVFVLQAFGRKRWEVHAAPREAPRAPLDVQVRPGDTIYLPAGTPHAATAQETLSGHLTIGVHVTPWRDVVSTVVERVLDDGDAADPVPAGWTEDPGRLADELRRRLDGLADRIRRADPSAEAESLVERFLSSRPQLARGTIVERAAPIEIGDDTVARRRPGSICRLRGRGDRLVALLGDRRLDMPAWVEPAMRRIAMLGEEDDLVVADLELDARSRAVLVARLVREGLLTTRGR